jgi:hypothetical protein
MNALKRHIDISVEKLEAKSAAETKTQSDQHQAALKKLEQKSAEQFEEIMKKNAQLQKQNSAILKLLKIRSET